MGSVDHPFNPVSLALGAEASFVARTIDSDRKHLTAVLSAAAAHRGTSLVEIYQNCPIFNDGAFDALKGPEAADRLVKLEPGLSVTVDGQTWEHDPADPNPARQFALSRMELPQVPVGIFRQVSRPAYDDLARQQVATDLAARGAGDLQSLVDGKDTWTVGPARHGSRRSRSHRPRTTQAPAPGLAGRVPTLRRFRDALLRRLLNQWSACRTG